MHIQTGKEKVAIINSIPKCGKSSNTVEVLLFGKNYEIRIGKNKCFDGFYQLGDPVNVIYSDIYDGAINANANVKIGYWMSICFFIMPIYFLYKIIRGDNDYILKPIRKKKRK